MSTATRHIRRVLTAATALIAIALWLAVWPASPERNAGAAPSQPVPSKRQTTHLPVSARLTKASADPTRDPTASLRPDGPPTVKPGSFMARSRARGYLIAGGGSKHLSFRLPQSPRRPD
jgi:hypothetical protein